MPRDVTRKITDPGELFRYRWYRGSRRRKMGRDFAKDSDRENYSSGLGFTNDGCIHLPRARLPTETHKLTPAHIDLTGGEHTRAEAAGMEVPKCVRGQAGGGARAHTRIHFQTRSFRDRETQAH